MDHLDLIYLNNPVGLSPTHNPSDYAMSWANGLRCHGHAREIWWNNPTDGDMKGPARTTRRITRFYDVHSRNFSSLRSPSRWHVTGWFFQTFPKRPGLVQRVHLFDLNQL